MRERRAVPYSRLAALAAIIFVAAALLAWWSPWRDAAPDAPPDAPFVASFEKFTPTLPRPAPDLAFVDAEGRTARLDDFVGQTVLLNLWATWCAPCVKEMPALDRLQAKLGGADFQVIALSLDAKGAEVVDPFFEKAGLTSLAKYYDPTSAAMEAFRPPGLPTSILIDAQGREIGRVLGDAAWDSPEAEALIRQAMER